MDQYISAAYRLQQLAMRDVARELRPGPGAATRMQDADPEVVGASSPARAWGRLFHHPAVRSRAV